MKNRRDVWFCSDWHYNHEASIGHTNRPFKNLKEMHKFLIGDWKRQVKDGDIVYCLGDMFWNTMKKPEIKRILDSLPGTKILIIGNHDKLTVHQAMNAGFDFACYEMNIRIGRYHVKLSHYPYRPNFGHNMKIWIKELFRTGELNIKYIKHVKKRPRDFGAWLVQGHTHSSLKTNFLSVFWRKVRKFFGLRESKKMIHIGVDAWDFKLVNESRVLSLMDKYEKENK